MLYRSCKALSKLTIPMHVQYQSQVTWQTSASSEEVTSTAWTFINGCKTRPQRTRVSTHMLAHIRTHSQVRIGRGPIIAPTRQWRQNQDNREFARLSYFLMNTGEFNEQREAVKDSPGIDMLPILYIFHYKSRVLMNVIVSTVTRWSTTLLESFSKLIERREAVKLYVYMCVAHNELYLFCCRVSNTCVRPCERMHSKRVLGTCGCRKLTREQALHYTHVNRIHLSSYLWAVLYDLENNLGTSTTIYRLLQFPTLTGLKHYLRVHPAFHSLHYTYLCPPCLTEHVCLMSSTLDFILMAWRDMSCMQISALKCILLDRSVSKDIEINSTGWK